MAYRVALRFRRFGSCAQLALWRGVLPRAPLPSRAIGRAMV